MFDTRLILKILWTVLLVIIFLKHKQSLFESQFSSYEFRIGRYDKTGGNAENTDNTEITEITDIQPKNKHNFQNVTPWHQLTTKPIETMIAFIHIPKTAGSSFYKLINTDKYGKSMRLRYQNIYPSKFYKNTGSGKKGDPESWNSPGCQFEKHHGGTHCSFSELEDCFNKRYVETVPYVKYMTVFREPVRRVISEYFWWRNKVCESCPRKTRKFRGEMCGLRDKDPNWPDDLCRVSGNFTAWLLSPVNVAHNRLAKSVMGMEKMEAPGSSHTQCFNVNGPKDIAWFQQEYSQTNDPGSFNYAEFVNSGMVMDDIYKKIDEKFVFIGTLEDISNSKDMMEYTMGSSKNFDFLGENLITMKKNDVLKGGTSRHKTGAGHIRVNDEMKTLILSLNQADLAVYEYVVQKTKVTRDLILKIYCEKYSNGPDCKKYSNKIN